MRCSRRQYTLRTFLLCWLIAWQCHAQNTFPSSGNVGIGTTTPSTKIHVVETASDASYAETHKVEQLMAAATTATHYVKALDIRKYWYNIPSTVTSGGYQIGLASQVFVSDTNFRGTLASQYGIWTRTGIYVAGSEGPRRINDAYGVYIEGLSEAGTIDPPLRCFPNRNRNKKLLCR